MGAVNGKAQGVQHCLKVLEVSVYVTKAHALYDTGATPDITYADFAAKSSVGPDFVNRKNHCRYRSKERGECNPEECPYFLRGAPCLFGLLIC